MSDGGHGSTLPGPSFTTDELWPRTPLYRFRIYAVVGGEHEVLAATPTPEGIGTALVQLHEDEKAVGRRLADRGRIGVMDVMPGGEPAPTGEWIVLPWDRG